MTTGEIKLYEARRDSEHPRSRTLGPGSRNGDNRSLQTVELARFVVAHASCGDAIEPMHEIRAGDRVLAFRCGGCGAREYYDPILAAALRRHERHR